MSRADQNHLTELQMGCNADRNVLSVRTYADGTAYITLSSPNGWSNFDTTLGQTIQLRDFLNRHIDELALKQTGSLAQRASDDPAQLAAVEEVPARPPIEVRLPSINGQEYDPLAVADFLAQCVEMLGQQGVSVVHDQQVLSREQAEKILTQPPAWAEGKTQIPFNPDRYKKD